ncbi:MAG: hypothetical protein QOG68_2643 [Solirubrobacteraceae bacterium]|jgi:plastocyanin|nr:hypothetical protein [Solirubrobacteraceae bacterium]
MIRALGIVAALAGPGAHHHRHTPKPPPRHYPIWRARPTPATLFPSLTIGVPVPDGPVPDPDAPAPPVAPPAVPAPVVYPTRTGVDEGEYFVRPAHRTLAAGAVELNAHNFGMDDHDLTIDDPGGHQVAQVYLVPGQDAQLELTLPAGSYRLYCSLYAGAHDQLGMHGTLIVKG